MTVDDFCAAAAVLVGGFLGGLTGVAFVIRAISRLFATASS